MDFLFYILVIFLAIISSSFTAIILTTLRVGLSFCNEISRSSDFDDLEKQSAFKLKKKYYISLLVDTIILVVIICIVVLLLPKYIIAYFGAFALFTLMSINKTGKNNQNNIQEFYNSLQCNYPQNDSSINDNEKIIQELMIKSGLPKQICTDVFEILVCFTYNDKELAHSKINTQLIPDLKELNDIGCIGIAFGMLIGENALTNEESTNYSSKLIKELVMNE